MALRERTVVHRLNRGILEGNRPKTVAKTVGDVAVVDLEAVPLRKTMDIRTLEVPEVAVGAARNW